MNSSMNAKLKRYFEVLRRTRLGFYLPFNGVTNYIKNRIYPYGEHVNPKKNGPHDRTAIYYQ